MYTGGYFTSIGGQTRNNIAALDTATALATAWNANAGSGVNTIFVSGSTLLILQRAEAASQVRRFLHQHIAAGTIAFIYRRQPSSGGPSGVLCHWSTATEENSAYFVIERSNNGRNFIPLG